MLGKIDESLAKQATQHCPFGDDSKKRKSNSVDDTNRRPSKKADTKNGADMTVVEREAKAMSDLANYIEEVGGKRFTSNLFVTNIDASKFLFHEREALAACCLQFTCHEEERWSIRCQFFL